MARDSTNPVCPNCGATIKALPDGSVGCEYCQTIIRPASPGVQRLLAAQRGGVAQTALVCGILSTFLGPLLAIPALIYGTRALDSIKKGTLPSIYKGKAKAGLICGLISIIVWPVLLVVLPSESDRNKKKTVSRPAGQVQQVAKPAFEIPPEATVPTESELPPLPPPPPPAPQKPLGSEERLKRILDAHVQALAEAKSESTSLRREQLTKEAVARTQKLLDANVWAVTVVVHDVAENGSYISIMFCRYVTLVPSNTQERSDFGLLAKTWETTRGSPQFTEDELKQMNILDFFDPVLMVRMDESSAAKIKKGANLVVQGRILVGYEGCTFRYKGAYLSIKDYSCHLAD